MTIALTITLAIVVAYYGAALLWQYHRMAAEDKLVQRRLNALQHVRDNMTEAEAEELEVRFGS